MAFMRRGDFPSVDTGNNQNDNQGYFGNYRYRRFFYYYVPLDNTYVIMQIIVTFIILIIGVLTFLSTYKSTIIDPIESTKKLFINSYLIIIGILLAINLVTNFLSKNATSLVKRLVIISIISIMTMLVFFTIKLDLNATYTKDKFGQLYTEQNADSPSDDTKLKVDIGIGGANLKTEKEYYVDECSKLYGIFSTKVYAAIRTSSFT